MNFPNFEFNLRTKTKVGLAEALNLGRYLKDMFFGRVGIIVDEKIFGLAYVQEILQKIQNEKFSAVKIWKYDLNSEPDYDSLDRVKLNFVDDEGNTLVDCFVGIGGGSVIDFAKGLATLATNSGKAINFRGFPTDIDPSLPTIALPTTAGTGSEVTFNAVFINKGEKKKLGINTRHNFPVMAILDPNLILSCPKSVAVSSGIDAMAHALEGFASLKSDVMTKMFAREAFSLMFNNLSKFLENSDKIESGMNMQLAAYLGGLTLLGSGGGPTGALSYALGVHFGVPHGLAGGVFLPYIVERNVQNGYDYGELCDAVVSADKPMDRREKNEIFSKKIFQLWEELGVPNNLRAFGVNENNVDILLKEVENYEKPFNQNPIPFSVEEGKKLILKLTN